MEIRFAGEYERTLDAKNRVAMPPKLKTCLNNEPFVICCMPREDFIRVYRMADWIKLTDEHLFVDDGVDRTALQRFVFHNSENCELDAQNRFMIQPKFLERTGITKDVVFAGIGKRIEIWAKDKYEQSISGEEFGEDTALVMPF